MPNTDIFTPTQLELVQKMIDQDSINLAFLKNLSKPQLAQIPDEAIAKVIKRGEFRTNNNSDTVNLDNVAARLEHIGPKTTEAIFEHPNFYNTIPKLFQNRNFKLDDNTFNKIMAKIEPTIDGHPITQKQLDLLRTKIKSGSENYDSKILDQERLAEKWHAQNSKYDRLNAELTRQKVLSPEQLDRVFERSQKDFEEPGTRENSSIWGFLENPKLSDKTANKIADLEPYQMLRAIASQYNPHLDKPDLINKTYSKIIDDQFKKDVFDYSTIGTIHDKEGRFAKVSPENLNRTWSMVKDRMAMGKRSPVSIPELVEHPNAPHNILHEAWDWAKKNKDTGTFGLQLANNPNIPSDLMTDIIKEIPYSSASFKGFLKSKPGVKSEHEPLILNKLKEKFEVDGYAKSFDNSLRLLARNAKNPEVIKESYYLSKEPQLYEYIANPNTPSEVLENLLKNIHQDKPDINWPKEIISHPNFSEQKLRELASGEISDPNTVAARKALKEIDPDAVPKGEDEGSVDAKPGLAKLRVFRDKILEMDPTKGELSPKSLGPGPFNGGWKPVQEKNGNISAKKIQELINSHPSQKYNFSHATWEGSQTHSVHPQRVFQLNVSTDQIKKMKDAGIYGSFKNISASSSESGHPSIANRTIGWVRYEHHLKPFKNPEDRAQEAEQYEVKHNFDTQINKPEAIHIDEIQTDMGPNTISKLKEKPERAKDLGVDVNHLDKMQDILFGKYHPSEVLLEAFRQHKRDIGQSEVPIHMLDSKTKAPISGMKEDEALPSHMQFAYTQMPKKMGFKQSTYGETEQQDNPELKNKPIWTDKIRKHEEELLIKAISDIKPGNRTIEYPRSKQEKLPKNLLGKPHIYDYNHLLSPLLKRAGYKLFIEHIPEHKIQAQLYHKNQGIGGISAIINPYNSEKLKIDQAAIGNSQDVSHRGKGLGQSMYEAVLAHAFHNGVKEVKGSSHSSMAHNVHKKLAQKHGLAYNALPNYLEGTAQHWPDQESWETAVTGPFDEKYGPYEYLLKGVMRRKAPFNPLKERLKPEDEASLARWQHEEEPAFRQRLVNVIQPESARRRSLHKIAGRTLTRFNPAKGENEYLLHRGLGDDEFYDSVNEINNNVNYSNVSSWTPDFNTAYGFSGGRKSRTVSAWIPESKISIMPRQFGQSSPSVNLENGNLSKFPGKNYYHEENEVLVNPNHFSSLATPEEIRNASGSLKGEHGLHARINAAEADLAKIPKADIGSVADKHKIREAVIPGMTKQRLLNRIKKSESDDSLKHPFRAAGFKHKETGQVVETGHHHDISKLPDGEDSCEQYLDGFIDHGGVFHDRDASAKIVHLNDAKHHRDWLDSYDEESGLEKHEDGVTAMLQSDDPLERILSLKSSSVQPHHLLLGIIDHDPNVRASAAQHPAINGPLLMEMIRQVKDLDILKFLLEHESCDEEHINTAMQNPLWEEADGGQIIKSILEKKTPPVFPKLGIPDSRREVELINDPNNLYTKLRQIHHKGAQKQYPGPVYTLDEKTNQVVQQPVSQETKDSLQRQAATRALRETKAAEHGTSSTMGAIHGPSLGYALSGILRPGMFGGSKHETESQGTLQHENLHSQMGRIEEKFGENARRALSENLFHALPRHQRDLINYIQDFYAGNHYELKNPKRATEEKIARLFNHINSPETRASFWNAQEIKNHELPNGDIAKPGLVFVPGENKLYDKMSFDNELKQAHRNLLAAGEIANENWLKWGHIKKNESSDLKDLIKHEDISSESLDEMLGYSHRLQTLCQAARFLSKNPTNEKVLANSIGKFDGDLNKAVLAAHGLNPDEKNIKALVGISKIQDLNKSLFNNNYKIEAIHPEAESTVDLIQKGIESGDIQNIKLGGKHSDGSLLVNTEDGFYILKPGSALKSPILGIDTEKASQSEREVAYYHIAKELGIPEVSKSELILLNGKQYAALKAVPFTFRSMDSVALSEPNIGRIALEPYRQSGALYKWALLDFILGSGDTNGGNVLVGSPEEDRRIALIDHGSAFAGTEFNPGHDPSAYVPYYLRAFAHKKWSEMNLEEKLKSLPRLTPDKEKLVHSWLMSINPDTLGVIMQRYGINAQPSLSRLKKLKESQGPIDLTIGKMWIL